MRPPDGDIGACTGWMPVVGDGQGLHEGAVGVAFGDGQGDRAVQVFDPVSGTKDSTRRVSGLAAVPVSTTRPSHPAIGCTVNGGLDSGDGDGATAARVR